MKGTDLPPARLAHIRGQGLLQLGLEATRDREDNLVYRLRSKGGVFLCEAPPCQEELELLCGKELTFFGYGQSELDLYTLTADVHLADCHDYPHVSLRVIRIHEAWVVAESGLPGAVDERDPHVPRPVVAV